MRWGRQNGREFSPGQRGYIRSLLPLADLSEYGAALDGITNDSPALARAIADVVPGGTIFVPGSASRCKLSSIVTIDRSVKIVGEGSHVSVFEVDSVAFRANASNVRFESVGFYGVTPTTAGIFLTKSSGALHNTDWRWNDCLFDRISLRLTKIGRPQVGGPATTGTDIAGHCQITGCEFTGCQQDYTVEIGGQENTLFEKNHVHDTGLNASVGEGVKVLNGSRGTRILANYIKATTRDGLDIYDSGGNTIKSNWFINCAVNGLEHKWAVGDPSLAECGENIIQGNHAQGCGGTGFNVDMFRTLVMGNFARQCVGLGFRAAQSVDASLTPTEFVTFVGNYAIDGQAAGFGFSKGNGFIINSNHARGNASQGIVLSAPTTNCVVVGNVCVNNTGVNLQNLGTGNIVANNYAP